jgi:hypothetical protein
MILVKVQSLGNRMNKKETKRRSTERNSLLVSIINVDGKRNEVGRPNVSDNI